MKRILLLVVALILYGSFYPWQFQARELTGNPLWILLHSWPDKVDRFLYRDAVVNLSLYAPFGAFCFLSMSARARAVRAGATVLAAMLLSSSVELTQLFDAGRVCSLFDVVCNTAGAAIGVMLAATFPNAISGVVSEAEAVGVFRLSGVVALLYLWAGYQLFPFFPAFSQHALRGKLDAFASAGIDLREFFENLAGWLAAAALWERLLGRRRNLLFLSLLAIPLKLLIAHRTTSPSEIAGALLGVGLWIALRGWWELGPGEVAIAALVAAGLTPFRFASQPQTFTWIPFLSMLQGAWESAFLVLLHKSFLYGSAVWLMNESRRGWLVSSLLVAVPLAVVEALQIYLPGRTPEVTDPLLAMLLGCGLTLMERHAAAARRT